MTIQGKKKWFAAKEGPRQEQAIISGSVFTETPVTQCILDHSEQELGCHPPWTNTSRLGLEQCSDEKYIKFLEIFVKSVWLMIGFGNHRLYCVFFGLRR